MLNEQSALVILIINFFIRKSSILRHICGFFILSLNNIFFHSSRSSNVESQATRAELLDSFIEDCLHNSNMDIYRVSMHYGRFHVNVQTLFLTL